VNPKRSALIKPNEFWIFVRDLRKEDGNYYFYELGALALMSLGVSHVNANPEKMFSIMNFLKNERRSCMHPETLDAVMRVREHCRTFDDDEEGSHPSPAIIQDYINKDFYQ